jgi:mRNA-degrading endonuclease toxin of MazEF toxin-antitoxin module
MLADQVKNLDRQARKCKRIQSLPAGVMKEVQQKMGALVS